MEDDQQFCLRWNNHQSTLIQNFDTLLESGTLVDCTLAAEGKYLKAHKVVLSACSPYFEGLLSEHYDKHPVFILKDVKFKELKAMMDYMYRGEVNISQDQLAALLKAAESLQIKGLSESKTGGSSSKMMDTRQQKVVPQTTATAADIPHMSSGLTIEKNKVPRQVMAHGPVGDLPEDTASPQLSKGLSSREGSQSPTSRKRKKFRRRSIGDESSIENHDASNSNDMPSQIGVPALGIAPVADEKSHADPTDSIGRSALMTQLTKPAEEMLQLPLEKPEPNDNLIEPKSEYLEDPEESVEDLTLDDDMNDLNEMEQDTNRAGPSHDPSQHPAGMGAWHVSGDRSNSGVVGSVAGAPGTTDEVFLAAQEAAQAHRDSQGLFVDLIGGEDYKRKYNCIYCGKGFTLSGHLRSHQKSFCYCNPRSTCHQSEKTRPFSCDQCGTRYAKQSHLIFHIRHDCGRTQKCTACGKTFLHSSSLRKHRQRPPCNLQETFIDVRRTYNTRSATSNHTMNSTNSKGGDGASASKDCGSSPVTPEWRNYKDTSHYKPVFSCNYCGTSYAGKHHLSRHVTNNCLKNPQARCNTDKKKRPFVCTVCGCRYKMRKALTYHMKHQCSSSATCPVCHKTMSGPVVTEKHLKLCKRKMGISDGSPGRTSPELISKEELYEHETINIESTDSD